jgi:hypothetical protein
VSPRPAAAHTRVVPVPLLRGLVACLPTLTALGCAGGDLVLPPDGEAARLEIVQGDAQVGTVGAPLTDSLVVRLLDQTGEGIPGRKVSWLVSDGGGSAVPAAATTDDQGLASARWTLGPAAGSNTLDAVVSGVGLVTFTAMGSGGDGGGGGRLELIEGNNQSAPAGSRVPLRPAVRVIDASGQPMAGFEVTFAVTGGGGSVEQPSQFTNSDGIARTDWTLGPTPGTNTLEARAGPLDGSPAVFVAEGTPASGVDHFVFRVQPRDVRVGERTTIEVAMVDAGGTVVPLSGIEIYLGVYRDVNDVPFNGHLLGDRFRDTEDGIAVFELGLDKAGRYRFRALSDELPGYPPHSPEPFAFSDWFDVD